MKKTVDIRTLNNGQLVADYRYRFEPGDYPEGWDSETAMDLEEYPTPGDTYQVAIVADVSDKQHPPRILFRPDDGGWRGNSDPNIQRYHGWRGTTNDSSVHGYGVRQCIEVKKSGTRSRRVIVRFGPDLKKDEE